MTRNLLVLLTLLGSAACRSADELPTPADPPAWPLDNMLAETPDGDAVPPSTPDPAPPAEPAAAEPEATPPSTEARAEEPDAADPSEPSTGG